MLSTLKDHYGIVRDSYKVWTFYRKVVFSKGQPPAGTSTKKIAHSG